MIAQALYSFVALVFIVYGVAVCHLALGAAHAANLFSALAFRLFRHAQGVQVWHLATALAKARDRAARGR